MNQCPLRSGAKSQQFGWVVSGELKALPTDEFERPRPVDLSAVNHAGNALQQGQQSLSTGNFAVKRGEV